MQVVWSGESFVIKDIRVEGLQRIAAGTVFSYLPVKVGDSLDEGGSGKVIRALFKTGFFKDVRLEKENGILIVFVVERPAIATISVNGNNSIEDEALNEGLKEIGFAVGRVFDKSLLDKVEQELQRIYFSQGQYGVKLETTVTPLERNRVGVTIDVSEGVIARIHQINIVGNKVFEDDDLLEEFALSTPTLFSFYTGNDQYSKQKLAGDLEKLRTHYLNRGYINFNIDSTQVSITPDRKDVFITINITEGDQFTVNKVKLAGELVVTKEKLFPLVTIQKGDTFSRRRATKTSENITRQLGNNGYAFANVNVVPEVVEGKKEVNLTFFIDPGKRVYVRRINYTGNTRTRDEVLRREMRQFESAWVSTDNIEKSQGRLRRLGYFEDVEVETPAVPGTTDQVDVNYTVKERASGNLLAGVGFSDSQGLILNASVSQNNFLGSGKRVSVGFDTSETNRVYRASYVNPYYTEDGVSRGFNISFRESDASDSNLASYSSDLLSAGVTYGIPITDIERITLRVNYQRDVIKTSLSTPDRFRNELAGLDSSYDPTPVTGSDSATFNSFVVTGSYAEDTRNKTVFPTRGGLQRVSAEVAVPGSDLEYYKLNYTARRYVPLTRNLTLSFRGDVGYGDGYGDTPVLPFFKNYLVGGNGSVRGYEANTLGPRIIGGVNNNDPIGGDLKLVGSAELIFPVPFVKDTNAWRFSTFVDGGNVFGSGSSDEDFEINNIRFAAGLGVTWLSPFGALSVSLATPFNEQENDETKTFQFNFGSGF
ncbi:MAG: outer membrane protein assembly factor BamA [Sulfuriflexus sp.]|nr:outer membrane protein assembly factor BamA [Sulfuriflexus sp.]